VDDQGSAIVSVGRAVARATGLRERPPTWSARATALLHPNRGASPPTTVTLAVAADDLQHCDGIVAGGVLLCRRYGSEPIGAFARSAIPANAVVLARQSIRGELQTFRPLPERTSNASATPTLDR
jgi:hypothetical protein